jgi:GNAT superfamily N-acetyltransferase
MGHGAQDFRADGALRDGTPVCVRAIRADDKVRLYAGFQRLSAGSIYRRFFSAKSTLTAHDMRYLTELDFVNHVGLAVTVGEGANEAFIGVGRFIRDSARVDEAEIALIVADEYQHRGVATLLLAHLASLARRLRIHKFVAIVQADNHEILELLQNSGLAVEARPEATGMTHVEVASRS